MFLTINIINERKKNECNCNKEKFNKSNKINTNLSIQKFNIDNKNEKEIKLKSSNKKKIKFFKKRNKTIFKWLKI